MVDGSIGRREGGSTRKDEGAGPKLCQECAISERRRSGWCEGGGEERGTLTAVRFAPVKKKI